MGYVVEVQRNLDPLARHTHPLSTVAEDHKETMLKILVIDDEAPIRMLLRTVLEKDGYEVREAADGRAGIALYRQAPADLVIADILMPELDGLDMIVELTREFLNVKVIAITGVHGEPDLLDRARLLGARHTLYKPFSLEQLLKVVRYELTH